MVIDGKTGAKVAVIQFCNARCILRMCDWYRQRADIPYVESQSEEVDIHAQVSIYL